MWQQLKLSKIVRNFMLAIKMSLKIVGLAAEIDRNLEDYSLSLLSFVGVIRPHTTKKLKILKKFPSMKESCHYASNEPSTIIKSIMHILCHIWKYIEIWPQTPIFLNLFKFYYLTQKFLQLRFQRAIYHLSKLILTQYMTFF